MLMNLESLDWHEPSLDPMGIPRSMLPEIRSASEIYGEVNGTPSAASPWPAFSAISRPLCSARPALTRAAPRTYGTGSFLLVNTGEEIVHTEKLLTGPAYKLGDALAVWVLEGSIAVTGALVQWLRDRLKIIPDAPSVEKLARTVEDNGGVYFVLALSGGSRRAGVPKPAE